MEIASEKKNWRFEISGDGLRSQVSQKKITSNLVKLVIISRDFDVLLSSKLSKNFLFPSIFQNIQFNVLEDAASPSFSMPCDFQTVVVEERLEAFFLIGRPSCFFGHPWMEWTIPETGNFEHRLDRMTPEVETVDVGRAPHDLLENVEADDDAEQDSLTVTEEVLEGVVMADVKFDSSLKNWYLKFDRVKQKEEFD